MAGNRKKYQQVEPVIPLLEGRLDINDAFLVDATYPPAITLVAFGVNASSVRNFDFGPWYGRGCDEITLACQRAIEHLLRAGNRSGATVASYCNNGLKHFLDFSGVWAASLKRPVTLQDIQSPLIEEFIGFLSRLDGVGYTTQKTVYTLTKAVLNVLRGRRLLPPTSNLFVRNPYPNSNRRSKGERPISEAERERLVAAIKTDLVAIFKGRLDRPMSEALSICFIAICLRTGRNTTPMMEISRDALCDHPFVPNLKLLVTFKRRGNATHLTPLQWQRDVDTTTVVNMDAVAIYHKVQDLTAPLVEDAPSVLTDRLWLFRSEGGTNSGQITALTGATLFNSLKQLVARHQLKADDGELLVLNTSRLRKTFINRLWRLSGGDPFAVARLGSQTEKVMFDSYLEPTPEMERDHRFLGEALVSTWRGEGEEKNTVKVIPIPVRTENTPIARCRDPYQGDRAPKNGKACIDFLSCFHCRSFVITDDQQDLYRLYSFYWFMVRERERIPKNRWTEVYGWIVRMIDVQVTEKFDPERKKAIKQRAHDDPHPFWRDTPILEAARAT